MQRDDQRGESAGSWAHWNVLRSVADPSVIRQVGDTCGHCAVRMWLAQQGRQVGHAEVLQVIGHEGPTTVHELARAINTLLGRKSVSSLVEFDDDRFFALYHPDWWIAMIKQYRRPAHWVVARGHGDEGTLEILDPADGTRSWVLWSEFDEYWTRYQVARYE